MRAPAHLRAAMGKAPESRGLGVAAAGRIASRYSTRASRSDADASLPTPPSAAFVFLLTRNLQGAEHSLRKKDSRKSLEAVARCTPAPGR
jgi:hypothetical protein